VVLREKSILNLGELHGRIAFLVIIGHMIDPCAHGIATHQPGIVGFQQFGRRRNICHAGVESQVVAIWIKDYWHPVVDGGYFPPLPHAGFLRVTVASSSIPGFGKLHLWRKRDTVTF